MLRVPDYGDVALIKAEQGDRWATSPTAKGGRATFWPGDGHCRQDHRGHRRTTVVELGALDPEAIVTPGIYVSHVVEIDHVATQAGGFKKSV